ncbi:hypothetical protein [Magnetospirillum aberrantis]|uniref:Uncharacterized protein n=1 Tax=Magnetospirillum aberrantis SpK TaxID=908842 RepID=A0A7C9UUH0_9PROT|nr:hypothetical protein [Magnetospirillum aberrantis]NFV79289.1 hypothetical protein [Magnetospirillum aberrantis SpK]
MSSAYKRAPVEVAQEIIRLSELHLQSMLTISIAADQRAATLAGIFTTGTVATLAAVAAAVSSGMGAAIIGGGVICALFLFVGSLFCVAALWPTNFHVAGIHPKSWLNGETLFGSRAETLLYHAQNYQERIDHNIGVNKRCSKLQKRGAALACAAPVVGVAVWVLLHFWPATKATISI